MCNHRKVLLKYGVDGSQIWTEGTCYKCHRKLRRVNKNSPWTTH